MSIIIMSILRVHRLVLGRGGQSDLRWVANDYVSFDRERLGA